jgi:hypothetical protein
LAPQLSDQLHNPGILILFLFFLFYRYPTFGTVWFRGQTHILFPLGKSEEKASNGSRAEIMIATLREVFHATLELKKKLGRI